MKTITKSLPIGEYILSATAYRQELSDGTLCWSEPEVRALRMGRTAGPLGSLTPVPHDELPDKYKEYLDHLLWGMLFPELVESEV